MGERRPRTGGSRRLPAASGLENSAVVQPGASGRLRMVAREFARHVEFHHQLAQGWNVVVAFDHRGGLPEELDGACVEIPYGRRDGVVMGIDQVAALIAMPGKVKLPDALLRHRVQI